MALDTKLILEALNYHFDKMDAKIDRWFSGGALLRQAVSGLPAAAVASPTSTPPSYLPAAAATTTFRNTIVVGSGTERTTTHHIIIEDDTTRAKSTRCSTQVPSSTPITNATALVTSSATPSTKSANVPGLTSATKTMASSAPSTSAVAPTTWVAAQAVARACSSAPTARGAEEGSRANLPMMCSTECFSHDIDVLQPVNSLTTVWYAPPPSVQFTANIPLDNINTGCFKFLPSTNIPNINPAHSIGADMLCLATNAHAACRPWDPGLYQMLGIWALLERNGMFNAQLQIHDSIFCPPIQSPGDTVFAISSFSSLSTERDVVRHLVHALATPLPMRARANAVDSKEYMLLATVRSNPAQGVCSLSCVLKFRRVSIMLKFSLGVLLLSPTMRVEQPPWPPPTGFAPTSGCAELYAIPWPSLIGQESFKLWHVTSIQDTVTSHSAGQSHCHISSHILTTEHHTICLIPVNQLRAWCISEVLLLLGKVSTINYGFPIRDDEITKGEMYRPWDPGNSFCRSCIRIGQSMVHIQHKLGAVIGVFLTLGTVRKNVLHLGQPGHPCVCMRKMVLHCLIIALTASCGASILKDGSSKYHKYMSRGVIVVGCLPDAIDQQQEVLVISVFSKQLKVMRVAADQRRTPWPYFSTVNGIPASWGFHWLWQHLWPLSHWRKNRQFTSKFSVMHTNLAWLQNLNPMCFGGVSDITTVLLLRIFVEFQILQSEPRRDTAVLQPMPWPSCPRHDLAFQEVSGHHYARAVTIVSPFHLHNNLWKGVHKYIWKKIYVAVHQKMPSSTFWEMMLAKNLQFSWDTMCATHESLTVLLAIMKTEVCLYPLKLSEEVHGLASEAAEISSEFQSCTTTNSSLCLGILVFKSSPSARGQAEA